MPQVKKIKVQAITQICLNAIPHEVIVAEGDVFEIEEDEGIRLAAQGAVLLESTGHQKEIDRARKKEEKDNGFTIPEENNLKASKD